MPFTLSKTAAPAYSKITCPHCLQNDKTVERHQTLAHPAAPDMICTRCRMSFQFDRPPLSA
jgi:hypothetical protein